MGYILKSTDEVQLIAEVKNNALKFHVWAVEVGALKNKHYVYEGHEFKAAETVYNLMVEASKYSNQLNADLSLLDDLHAEQLEQM